MRKFIATTVAALSFYACAAQAQWPLEELNRAIEQTNFIVDEGCSGTLVSLSGLILTNYHCIEDKISSVEREVTNADGWVRKVRVRRYADVTVEQHGYDGFARVRSASHVAEIVAEDKRRDLAVLRIKSAIPHTYATPILPEGESVTRGERVYIVGNPLGKDATIVEGIVSNVNRTFEFPWTDNEKLPIIQFSGGLAGGNSGGALYNARGQLIGVPAAGYLLANFIGLAIPATVVKAFLRENCLATVFDATADDAGCREAKRKRAAAKDAAAKGD